MSLAEVGNKVKTRYCEVFRHCNRYVRKEVKRSIHGYEASDLVDFEVSALDECEGLPGLQQIYNSTDDSIYTEYAGEQITKNCLPLDEAARQLYAIASSLEEAGIVHRDIRPDNLVIKDGVITLIDFTWAYYEGCLFESINDHPKYLGRGYKPAKGFDNLYSLDKVLKEYFMENPKITELREKIKKIGVGEYQDGNSTRAGVTYQPIPFPPFNKEIRSHKKECIKEYALIKQDVEKLKLSVNKVLDIGSNIGYFCFKFAEEFGASCTGIEREENSCAVAESLAKHFDVEGAEFLNTDSMDYIDNVEEPVDLTVMLNVHMWIWKQNGRKKVTQMMQNLAKKSKVVYFQTAHKESGGMYTIDEFEKEADIVKHLKECGFKYIERINVTKGHKGIRIMFRCSKEDLNETVSNNSDNKKGRFTV